MTTSRFRTRPPRDFVSTGAHHWPRVDRGSLLLFLGSVTLWCGIYLIRNDLPETLSQRAQITLQGMPTIFGGICVLFGVVGLVSGIRGSVRTGADAIDLKPSARGLRVRGDHLIPWESISAVTAVQYQNDAKLQILWDRADLNRALVLHLDELLGVPRITVKDGEARLRIPLLRYPAVDYRPLYESMLEEFARRGVRVEVERKHKQT
ncbi:MAG: hypothetical protein ACTMII_12465 [Brachybacterium sp.]